MTENGVFIFFSASLLILFMLALLLFVDVSAAFADAVFFVC